MENYCNSLTLIKISDLCLETIRVEYRNPDVNVREIDIHEVVDQVVCEKVVALLLDEVKSFSIHTNIPSAVAFRRA